MRLFKRASDALKDAGSLFVANLTTPRSASWNPEIESAVIKATNHDNTRIDYSSAQRIFAWTRVSSHYICPVLSAISTRMEKTRSWTVALKGLMLLHGVFSCKVPAVQRIGRLPFDLSNFKDRKPNLKHHEAFIRAYYTYLQEKALFMSQHAQEQKEGSLRKGMKNKPKQSSMMQDLVWLQNLQGLLDVLLKIKPQKEKMMNVLILEAMDCIVVEIFDIYSRICNAIAAVLVRIYSVGKTEAAMAFSVLQKAAVHAKDLTQYTNFCKDFGVIKASESPRIVHIRDEDIQALKHIIETASSKRKNEDLIPKTENNNID